MAIRRVRLSFPGNLIKEPVVYQLGRKFNIVTNIRRADVNADYGWVVLEIQGDEDATQEALDWAAEIGVLVGPIEGDLIAG